MATKAKVTPEISDDIPDGVKKRMQNLKQYSGKKKEKEPEIDFLPVHIDDAFSDLVGEAKVPVVSEDYNPAHTIPITAKAVLNKEEYKIYINEVREWLESHPDWTLKEDLDDIYGIAMEKVLQFRLLMKKKRHPRTDTEKDYNSSVYRMQGFRQNLAARRADRISGKNKVVNQTNIAIIASQMDAEQIEQLRARALKNQQEELEMFPEFNS